MLRPPASQAMGTTISPTVRSTRAGHWWLLVSERPSPAAPSTHRHGYSCEQAEREIDAQMASKLKAQTCLRLICEGIDLPLHKLADGWTASLPIILAHIETIVDESERAFSERDDARHGRELARLDTERERREVQWLRDALERVYQIGRGPHVAIAREALDAN